MDKAHPNYLNLLRIRLPPPGIVSIMHRISGAMLLPVMLWWLQQSLLSFNTFTALKAAFSYRFVKLLVIGLPWGYFHHLFSL